MAKKNDLICVPKVDYDDSRLIVPSVLVSVVVGFEGSGLCEPHVFGLFISQLCQVRIECSQMEAGNKLVHQLGHQINVRLVTASRSVEQL